MSVVTEESPNVVPETESDFLTSGSLGFKVNKGRPRDIEVLREHDIRIEFLSGRGCLVSIGCKRIAFEDNQKAMEAISAYVANPYEEAEKWNKIFNQ